MPITQFFWTNSMHVQSSTLADTRSLALQHSSHRFTSDMNENSHPVISRHAILQRELCQRWFHNLCLLVSCFNPESVLQACLLGFMRLDGSSSEVRHPSPVLSPIHSSVHQCSKRGGVSAIAYACEVPIVIMEAFSADFYESADGHLLFEFCGETLAGRSEHLALKWSSIDCKIPCQTPVGAELETSSDLVLNL
eukprot:3700293-Amphidinium_carterae.1